MGLVYLAPLGFTACASDSTWCDLAFGFTTSGGPLGFLILLLLTGAFYASTAPTIGDKITVFFKSIVSLAIFFGVLAFVNEHYTKHILKSQRPSHIYMLSQAGMSRTIDSLYTLDKKERQEFFAALIRDNPVKFAKIDKDIQEHWIEEAGFSFPSGHTFNAFLFAMIIAYAIYFNRSRPQLRHLYIMPFVWALTVGVSRVAMGAHTPFDVSFGAAFGILTGTVFLYIGVTRHWLTRKN